MPQPKPKIIDPCETVVHYFMTKQEELPKSTVLSEPYSYEVKTYIVNPLLESFNSYRQPNPAFQQFYQTREKEYDLILRIFEENGDQHDEYVHSLVIQNETNIFLKTPLIDKKTGERLFEFELNNGMYHAM